VLPQKYALPGTECQVAIDDRYCHGSGRQCSLDVCWHVVWTLEGVRVDGVIFRHQAVEPVFKVLPGSWVVVLLYQQARRGVADEQVAYALVHAGFPDLVANRGRDVLQTLSIHIDIQAGCQFGFPGQMRN